MKGKSLNILFSFVFSIEYMRNYNSRPIVDGGKLN